MKDARRDHPLSGLHRLLNVLCKLFRCLSHNATLSLSISVYFPALAAARRRRCRCNLNRRPIPPPRPLTRSIHS
ncbi:hypothetical protein VNO80_15354 [Phaseolus coccineus]|uniref:Uncharacterized protein n=1 Tax=Phaseolus coccineus TaxID=3886 RepID=A0AAN9R6X9_PHACN